MKKQYSTFFLYNLDVLVILGILLFKVSLTHKSVQIAPYLFVFLVFISLKLSFLIMSQQKILQSQVFTKKYMARIMDKNFLLETKNGLNSYNISVLEQKLCALEDLCDYSDTDLSPNEMDFADWLTDGDSTANFSESFGLFTKKEIEEARKAFEDSL